jgi:hypothetical protein
MFKFLEYCSIQAKGKESEPKRIILNPGARAAAPGKILMRLRLRLLSYGLYRAILQKCKQLNAALAPASAREMVRLLPAMCHFSFPIHNLILLSEPEPHRSTASAPCGSISVAVV